MIPNDVANKKLLKSDWLSAFSTIIREYKVCQTWGLRRKLIFTINSKQNVLINFFKITKNIFRPFYNKAWRRIAAVITSVQLHAIKSELEFRTDSNPARGM